MNFSSLLTIIATLFLLMICGFIARKLDIIPPSASKQLATLIMKIGQPMMIISALVEAEFSYANLKDAIIIVVVGFFLHLILAIIAYFACCKYKNFDDRKITEFSLLFANCGFIGFPIMEALFGTKGLFLASFFVISFHIFLWTWGMSILARKRSDIKLTVKKVFVNFGTIPCVIGVIIYLLAIPFPTFVMPEFISKFLLYLSNLCTPISVLITGALLASKPLKPMFISLRMYYFSFVKLIAMPLIICLIATLVGLDQQTILFCTAMAALPSAATVTIFAEVYDINSAYAAQTVGFSSLLSVLTVPIVLKAAEWIIAVL